MRTVEVTDDLQAYLDGLVPKRDAVLARMEKEADREGIPIVEPHEGMLLYLLVKIARAKRVLELGTATGYSGIWMLRGSGGGTLTTYEMDPARAQRARANFAEAGFGKAAIVLEENAKDGLEKLEGRFDACFIDLLNSFQSEEITPKNQQAKNVAAYNDLVAKHPRLESVVIPIRDGLSVARVKD